MKLIKHTLLGLVLSTCAAFASAYPTYQDTFFVQADMDVHGGSMQSWTFGAGDPTVMSGETFVYDFLFNTPPPTAWFGFYVNPDNAGDVAFTDASFYPAPDNGVNLALSADQVSGNTVVDSGLYDLQLAGTFMADGGGFTGQARANFATVPEPVSLGLVGIGLAGLAGARRRKAAKAAKAA